MQTKPKSNSVLTSSVRPDGVIVINVLGGGVVEFDPRRVDPALRQRAEAHGWIQRLADGAAKSRNAATGLPASPQEKFDAVRAIADHYLNGATEWKMTGTGGGRMAQSEIILQALARVREVDIETLRERIAAMAEKKGTKPATLLAALAVDKEVAAMVLTIQAERAGALAIDAEELMMEIME